MRIEDALNHARNTINYRRPNYALGFEVVGGGQWLKMTLDFEAPCAVTGDERPYKWAYEWHRSAIGSWKTLEDMVMAIFEQLVRSETHEVMEWLKGPTGAPLLDPHSTHGEPSVIVEFPMRDGAF